MTNTRFVVRIVVSPRPAFSLEQATYCRSEGFALTGYDIPGFVEDGAWMPWENSSVVAAAVAAAVAHPGLEKLFEFHYGIGASGVRGSIRLVFRSTDAQILSFFPCRKKTNIKKQSKKTKNG